MYQFSAPMPYNIDDINKLLNINNEVEKSRITSLYACLPSTCEFFTGFEQSRNFAFEYSNWNYWKKLIEYIISYNCDFIYLLNSPRPFDIENPNFLKQLEILDKLLNELKQLGINKLRIASLQLMSYINKHYSDFQVFASTSIEYKTILEYQNFIEFHPEVKQIVPSHDVNKNFRFLKNFKKNNPDIEIELMVNEGCLQGCPNRMLHEYINIDKFVKINDDLFLSNAYATSFCKKYIKQYPIHNLVKSNLIFPWDIQSYEKIGIKNFKLVGRDSYIENFQYYIYGFLMYLKCIENIKSVENYSISDFTHHLSNNPILKQINIKDYKKYLPNIKYFVKYGHLCASRCGTECRYCLKCAEKIQNVFEKKQEAMKKRMVSVCVINKI